MSDSIQTTPGSGNSTTDAAAAHSGNRDRCRFCRIVDGKEKNSSDKIIYQDEEFVVFPDIRPAAKHHLLVVTKEHIKDSKSLTAAQIGLLDRLVETGAKVLADNMKGLENDNETQPSTPPAGQAPSKTLMGFHWPPFHTISHLHLHVISPSDQMGFIGRIIFRPNSYWFVQPDWVKGRLEKIRDESKS